MSVYNIYGDIISGNAGSAVSILSLGGKNDGTEDIGQIVNNYTSEMAIFLPVGKYLVTTPIVLTNSLFGENSILYYTSAERSDISSLPNSNSSIIVSGLNSGDIITMAGSGGSATLSNINIVCHGNESAINIGGTNRRFRISNVSVTGLNDAKGVYASTRFSGNVYLDNFYVLATPNKESIGVDLSGTVDSGIANTRLLYTQVGMKLDGLHYMSNVHIWCGGDSSSTKSWADDTVGIYCGSSALIFGTNVYVDTAYSYFYLKTGARAWIKNLMTWDDKVTQSVEDTLHLINREGTSYIWIDGGCYNTSGRMVIDQNANNNISNFVAV